MRSGTSFFDWTTFKKTVFRFWPLWGVYLAGWIIVMPLSGLMQLRMEAGAQAIASAGFSDVYTGYMRNFALRSVPSMAAGHLQTGLIFGVLAAMAVFSHLYNARSANLFGSLPIRREGLFLTHYLAGMSFFIVPNAVIFLLTLAVEAAGGYVRMDGLLLWLGLGCGEGFFFYTLAVLCAMFTGHLLALPAFYAIANGLIMGVTGLVYIVLQAFYYGFAGFPDGVHEVVQWFTPAVKLENAVSWNLRYPQHSVTGEFLYDKEPTLAIKGLGTVGIYVLAAVALAACAFLLYRVRRLESAGDVVAVQWMKPVFKYGVSFCAGLALGLGTMVVIGGGEIPLMIAIVIWGIIGYFAAEMLLQKSFKVFKKWKGAAAVTAVFAALFCVVGFDLTGFETRIPDPSSVTSVHVWGLEVMYLQDDGDRFNLDVTDPEVIRMVAVLHKAAVEQRDGGTWDQTAPGVTSTNTTLNVTYRLKNGGTLSRSYYTVWVRPDEADREDTAAWALQRIYENKELCWQMYGFNKLENYLAEGGRLTEVQHTAYSDFYGDRPDAYYYGGDAEALLAAVKEDFFAGRIGARRVTEDKWEGYYGNDSEFLYFKSNGRGSEGYYSVRIALSDTATSTLAALEEMADRAVRPDTGYDMEDWTIQDIMDSVTQ